MLTTAITAIVIVSSCVASFFTPVAFCYEHGGLVIEMPEVVGAAQINGAFIGRWTEHEHGHYLQQQAMGDLRYYLTVAAPSLLTATLLPVDVHRSMPWERDANLRLLRRPECH